VTRIESMADLKPGDIFFGPIGGAVGLGVGIGQALLGEGWSVGPLKIRHVGVVVESLKLDGWTDTRSPRMVQAMPSGAEEIEMDPNKHWTPTCAYVRLPEDYPGQMLDVAAIARLMVSEKVAYSFASYLALAAWRWGLEAPRLERWIDRRGDPVPFLDGGGFHALALAGGVRLPREAICSVLADQCLTLAGKSVMIGTPKQCVTPGKLAARLLFETPGAEWSFPRRTSPVL
jgi:hypothetical protein